MLWEFTGGKEDQDNFIQKALKVYKIFKVNPLKAPRSDAPSKKTAYRLFCKDIRKIKKELQSLSVHKTRGIISKKWKKVIGSEKKMKKYKEKKKNNNMKRPCRDIKIIWIKWKLLASTKGVARRPGRPHSLKKPSHPSQINLCQGFLIQAWMGMNRSLKKQQGQAMEKRLLQRQKKKLKGPNS